MYHYPVLLLVLGIKGNAEIVVKEAVEGRIEGGGRKDDLWLG